MKSSINIRIMVMSYRCRFSVEIIDKIDFKAKTIIRLKRLTA